MLETFSQALKNKQILNKILFTLLMIFLYKVGSYIPLANLDLNALRELETSLSSNGVFSFINVFSGGSLQRFSLFALGIMPYVIASIVLQFLQIAIGNLAKKEKDEITQYTRYLTIFLALLQSTAYYFLIKNNVVSDTSLFIEVNYQTAVLTIITLTAGCILLMRIGELITAKGIGNGISIIILVSLLSSLPSSISIWWNSPDVNVQLLLPAILFALLYFIIFIQEGLRKIPVQYNRDSRYNQMTVRQRTFLPLKLNIASIIPVIISSSLIMAIFTLISLITSDNNINLYDSFLFYLLTFIFIFILTFLYTAVIFNPVEQADNLNKQGGFIPGFRPGSETAIYLDYIVTRLTLFGALYLCGISIIPNLFIDQNTFNYIFSGTSILIIVVVLLDIYRQLESYTKDYDNVINNAL